MTAEGVSVATVEAYFRSTLLRMNDFLGGHDLFALYSLFWLPATKSHYGGRRRMDTLLRKESVAFVFVASDAIAIALDT